MTVTEIPRPAEREEWLRTRHSFANASDAAVYLGCHPFKDLADLTVEKLAENPPDVSNRAMERGNRLEAAIADWWADEHGVGIYEPDVMYAAGRLLATLDRRIVGNDREALEVKSTTKRIDEVEPSWFWQVQAQMLCADLDRVHIAALDGTMDLKSFVVERDDEAIQRLVRAVDEVWSFFDLGMAPEGVQLDADQIAAMYPMAMDEVELDADAADAVKRWDACRLARLEAEKAEKEAKDEVARLLGEHEAGTHAGRVLVTWKTSTRTSVDVKRLEADHKELVEKYRRTSYVRTMRAGVLDA